VVTFSKEKDLNILRANGRIVGIGASAMSDQTLGNLLNIVGGVLSMKTFSVIDLMLKSKGFYGVNMKVIADNKRNLIKKEFEDIMKLFNEKAFVPDAITEVPWEDIAKAHSMLETRKSTGKIVMVIQ